jgi:hypothetical protein
VQQESVPSTEWQGENHPENGSVGELWPNY